LVYDLRGDGRTALKFAANRYNQPINISIISRLNPVSTTSDQRAWTVCGAGQTIGCDVNGDKVPQVSELGGTPGFVFAGVNARYADDLKRPISNEYTAEIQQQLPVNMVLSIGYTHRETRRGVVQKNTAVDPSSWTGPFTVTEVVSGQQVQVWGRPSTASANLFFNSELADRTYNGADITLNKRMSSHFSFTGGATLGKTRQASNAGNNNTNLTDPNVANNPYFSGNITTGDRPWSYRASGVVDLPGQFQFSGTQVIQAGDTETTTVLVTNQTINLAQGNQTVQAKPVGAVRYPVLKQLDLSLRRNFRANGKSFSPRLDIFNATNEATITAWVAQLGPNYHVPSGIQRGRAVKFSVSAEF